MSTSLTVMRAPACLLLLLAAVACDGDPAQPTDNSPRLDECAEASAPVLGLGCVNDRFTSELWVHDGWAYTGTWGTRGANVGNMLMIWEVTGPLPTLRDSIRVDGAVTLGDVEVSADGRLLVVATEFEPGSIVIYDLADPARPRELSRFSSASTRPGVHTAELAAVDGRLYALLSIPGGPSLVIVDLSDPSNPREVLSRTMGEPLIHDVFVRDGLLFTALWNAGMTIWDIGSGGRGGTPADPVQISNLRTVGGSVHNIWWFHDPVTGSKRYAFVGEEGPASIGASASGDIHVVDVSDLDEPREVAFFTVPGAGTHNFSVDEASGILYAAYYNGGVRALDVRGDLGDCTRSQRSADGRCDLGAMGREVEAFLTDSEVDVPVFVWGVHQLGSELYASDMLNGIWKVDVSSLRR